MAKALSIFSPRVFRGSAHLIRTQRQIRHCRSTKNSQSPGVGKNPLFLIRQSVIMATAGMFPQWHESAEEGSIHSICVYWGKLLKAVPGLLTIRNVEKVKRRVFWVERTMPPNAPAGVSAWHGG